MSREAAAVWAAAANRVEQLATTLEYEADSLRGRAAGRLARALLRLAGAVVAHFSPDARRAELIAGARALQAGVTSLRACAKDAYLADDTPTVQVRFVEGAFPMAESDYASVAIEVKKCDGQDGET